ncbi:hypothetical protein DVH24_008611 [Malus domestica]|uniref:Uncharacterized protein n=1 Tax=Malus domestica TaxID=3750 RepID=A0A498JS87_MALDO|nr:hypothetical protein DVH24_008611 [Malus domestica]
MAFPVGFLCYFILCLPFPAIAFFFLSSTSTRVGHRGKKSGGKPTKAKGHPFPSPFSSSFDEVFSLTFLLKTTEPVKICADLFSGTIETMRCSSLILQKHSGDLFSFLSNLLCQDLWRKKVDFFFQFLVKEEPRRDMFTEGLDRSALHGVRKSSAPFVPYPILVDPCSIGHLPLFAFLFSPDISASMIRQTRRSRLLSRTRCPMGTTDCSKLSQRSGEICYVAPDYANYEALEKWCGNWLFVIDEKERFFVLHFLLYHLGLCKLFIIGDPFMHIFQNPRHRAGTLASE